MFITPAMMIEKGATDTQVELFTSLWPDGQETNSVMAAAWSQGLDLDWIVRRFLAEAQKAAFQAAVQAARNGVIDAIAEARETYETTMDAATDALAAAAIPPKPAFAAAARLAYKEAIEAITGGLSSIEGAARVAAFVAVFEGT